MKCTLIIEKGPNSWGAYLPDLPGCAAAGESRDEAVRLIKEAVESHLQGLKVKGMPIPAPSSETEYIDMTVM